MALLAPAVPLWVFAETDFTAVQRAGAKCPVRCADGEPVGAVVPFCQSRKIAIVFAVMDKKPFIMARTGFNKHDIACDACQLFGPQAHQGYDWWWHSFTGHDAETGEEKPFFIEFFLCNPALGTDKPVFRPNSR